MSKIAAEVKFKLTSVLIEKKPIQPHSELNALEGILLGSMAFMV